MGRPGAGSLPLLEAGDLVGAWCHGRRSRHGCCRVHGLGLLGPAGFGRGEDSVLVLVHALLRESWTCGCGTCGWQNQISCPVCDKALQRKQHGQLTLDVCHSCQGIWFDQAELVSLWNDSSTNLSHPSKHTSDLPQQSNSGVVSETARQIAVEGGLNSIAYGAEVVVEPGFELMAKTASTAAQGSVKVLANTPETAGSVVESLVEVTGSALEILTDSETITVILEASGEIAGGVVEILATAIAGLLSG